jgi:hypothetical protein
MRFDTESRESHSFRKMKSLYQSIRVGIFLRTEILKLTYDLHIAVLYFRRVIESTSALWYRIVGQLADGSPRLLHRPVW